jgi:hypothetical protein
MDKNNSHSQRRPREELLLSESRTGDETMTRTAQMHKHRTSFMADELCMYLDLTLSRQWNISADEDEDGHPAPKGIYSPRV